MVIAGLGCGLLVAVACCRPALGRQPQAAPTAVPELAVARALRAAPEQQVPPLFRIVATDPRDAGLQHGRLVRERIRGWFETAEMKGVMAWVAGAGAEAFAQLRRDNAAEFPAYAEEMEGMAEGAGVSVKEVWAANLLNELETLMSMRVTGHCSDMYVKAPGGIAHGHNEDWSPDAKRFWYFLSITAAPGAVGVDDCAGLVYAGANVGWAPTWNAHGIYATQNSLMPRQSRPRGLACALVQRRAVCGARSLADVVAGLTKPGWSDGASMNVVDLRAQRMANVELWEDSHSVLEVTSAMSNYSHFNEYKHMTKADGQPIDDPKSFNDDTRQAIADAMPAPRSADDVRAHLSSPGIFFKDRTLALLVLNGTTGRLDARVSPTQGAPAYSWDLLHFFDPPLDSARV